MASLRVGISGWLYPRWRGTFYPKGLAQRDELRFAASKFNAIEVNGTFYSMKKHNAALVFADTAGKFCYAEDVTSDFIYIRLHGSTELYTSGYSDEELGRWTERIGKWRAGDQPADAVCVTRSVSRRRARRDVYVFFDNDAKIHAPFDAQRLAALLQQR